MIGISRLGPIRATVRAALRDLDASAAADAAELRGEAAAAGIGKARLQEYLGSLPQSSPYRLAARWREGARRLSGEVIIATVAAEAVDLGDNAEAELVAGLEKWATVTARYGKAIIAADRQGPVSGRAIDRLTAILSEAFNTAAAVLDTLGDDTGSPDPKQDAGGPVWRLAQSVRLFCRRDAREAAAWRRVRVLELLGKADTGEHATAGASRQARYRRLKNAGFVAQATVPVMAEDIRKLQVMGLLGQDPSRPEIQAALSGYLVEKLISDQNREE